MNSRITPLALALVMVSVICRAEEISVSRIPLFAAPGSAEYSFDTRPEGLSATSTSPITAPDGKQYLDRGTVHVYTGISFAFQLAMIVEQSLQAAGAIRVSTPLFYGTFFGEHLPVYFLDPLAGLLFSGVELAGIALYELNRSSWQSNPKIDYLAAVTINQLGAMYSTYEIYKTSRLAMKDPYYTKDWKPNSFLDLALSPFTEPFKDRGRSTSAGTMIPYLFLGLWTVIPIKTAITYISDGSAAKNSVFSTGTSYIGEAGMHPALGFGLMLAADLYECLAVAVGEEALYRGVIYEELRATIGPDWAKLADPLFFAAIHIPQEVAANTDAGTIALNFLARAGMTLILDFMYDLGGLPLSTAVHMWVDFGQLFVIWMCTGGKPASTYGLQYFFGITPAMTAGYEIPLFKFSWSF